MIHEASWTYWPNGPTFRGRVEWNFAESLLSNIMFVNTRTAAMQGQIFIREAKRWRHISRLHDGLMPSDSAYWFDPPRQVLEAELFRAANCFNPRDYLMSLIDENWKPHHASVLNPRREDIAMRPEWNGKDPFDPYLASTSNTLHSLHGKRDENTGGPLR